MQNRRFQLISLVVCLLLTAGWTVGRDASGISMDHSAATTTVKTERPTAALTPTPSIREQSAPSGDIREFLGKWIAYNTVSLEKGRDARQKPGVRLEISNDSLVFGAAVCEHPVYTMKTVSLEEFLKGNKPPEGVIEWNNPELVVLSTGCANLESLSIASLNIRTLAVLIENDLLYFEPNFSVTDNGLTIESELLTDSSKDPLFEIHAQLPVLQKTGSQSFNNRVRQIVATEMNGFRKGFSDWSIPPEMDSYHSFMWISYDVPLLTENLVSIRFAVDYYMAGAAHPNHYFKVLNFDLKNDRELLFADIFKDRDVALERISELCQVELNKPDFPLFPEGLTPTMQNFQNWNLEKSGLRMSFDPYQVAPYAAGPQEVHIPYSEIGKLIDPTSPVGALIAH
ncbi:MAG: DUF3298 and DUF4163 domain-containing protein [Leptolinea sp.]|nr:DUF3298 and DUF4163 domain-containing protein [Leptolinea sp.]